MFADRLGLLKSAGSDGASAVESPAPRPRRFLIPFDGFEIEVVAMTPGRWARFSGRSDGWSLLPLGPLVVALRLVALAHGGPDR